VPLVAAITFGVSAIAYGIVALMVVLECQDDVALRICHFGAMRIGGECQKMCFD
jgi:hypothetical protein